MTGPKINWEINISTIVHLGALIMMTAALYGSFNTKFAAHIETMQQIQRQTERMEHYLSQKDPEYWRTVTANGDHR
jgi:hypothetical protein